MSQPIALRAFVLEGGIDETRHEVTALVKTTQTDRHRTLFLPESFARTLPVYLASNPIFLWQHRQRGNPEDALGNAVSGRVTPAGPEVTFRYAVEANPQAALVWSLVVARVLRAYSIAGWILASVSKMSDREEIDALPDYARAALLAGDCDEVVTDIELAEISQVLIGSDRGALIQAATGGLVTPELALRMMAEIEETKETPTMATTPTQAQAELPSAALTQVPAVKLERHGDTEERGMTPAQMDAAARLMGVMRCIGDCGCCRCGGCDPWDGCRCNADCCCCQRDGDCGTCPCCQTDAKTIAGCCDILDAVCAGLRAKYAPASSEEPSAVQEGKSAAVERAGAAISKANAEKLGKAKGKCEEAIGHLDEVMSQAADDKEEQAAETPVVRAVLRTVAQEHPDLLRSVLKHLR